MTTFVISSNPAPAPNPTTSRPDRAGRDRYLVSPRILVALLALATVSVLATSVQADQPVAVQAYTVRPGDTLWSIAAEITPAGVDVREAIAVVRELNELDASVIHPGQVLKLPEG